MELRQALWTTWPRNPKPRSQPTRCGARTGPTRSCSRYSRPSVDRGARRLAATPRIRCTRVCARHVHPVAHGPAQRRLHPRRGPHNRGDPRDRAVHRHAHEPEQPDGHGAADDRPEADPRLLPERARRGRRRRRAPDRRRRRGVHRVPRPGHAVGHNARQYVREPRGEPHDEQGVRICGRAREVRRGQRGHHQLPAHRAHAVPSFGGHAGDRARRVRPYRRPARAGRPSA